MAEGDLVLERMVESEFPVLSVLCTPARMQAIEPLLSRLPTGTPIYLAEPSMLESLIGFHLHRGLMAIGARTPPRSPTELLQLPGIHVVLEDLTNHDNIGAIFRNAAAFGAVSVLLSPGCADPLYRKAIRVSMGHALRVPFARFASWPDGLAASRGAGAPLLALSPAEPAQSLRDWRWPPCSERVCVMFGSEGPGLTAAAMAAASARIVIPMSGGVDSLNVAVTSALTLEHLRWARERRDG